MTARGRLNAMMIIRRADQRLARAACVEATADVLRQKQMARRLDAAASATELPAGLSAGAILAAKGELAGRIQHARSVAVARVGEAAERFGVAAQDRHTARIAIEQIETRQAAALRMDEVRRAAKMPQLRGKK